MSVTVFLFLILAVGGGVFLYGHLPAGAISERLDQLFSGDSKSKGRKRAKGKRNQPQQKITKYRAVCLRCGDNPCAAAKKLEGKRALVGRFPKTPLTLCDVEVCNCTFEHHDDRRAGDDRREILKSLANDKDARFNEFKSRSGAERRRAAAKEELDKLDIGFD